MSARRVVYLTAFITLLIVVSPIAASTQNVDGNAQNWQPLHTQIDSLIEAHADFKVVAAQASDAEFLRRVTLDLTGTIPSSADVRAFLADASPEKRSALIDELLASPRFPERMQNVFDVMLMERRPEKHVKAKEWRAYLRTSFRENKAWDVLTAEMLSADGAEQATRPAARFLLDRELKTDVVTRDLGRIFLGRDLQCAQCHDHPAIDEYRQLHYYGLAAFIKRSYLFRDPKTKVNSIGEKAEGEVEFTSVFTAESDATVPRMLDLPPLQDPPAEKEPYKVRPVKNVRAVPLYSRRLQLAKAMTSPENTAFRLNIANRLWALMMGRGIVEPVDMWHADNPPSHPVLLQLLADGLMEHEYDIRFLLREIALSRAYQRSSVHDHVNGSPAKNDDLRFYTVAIPKPLSPEQMAWSMMQATGVVEEKLATLEAAARKDESKKKAAKNKRKETEAVAQPDPYREVDALRTGLKSEVDAFVKVFQTQGIQTSIFDASANQALFLRNGSLLQSWITPKRGLTAKLAKLETPRLLDELYLSVYSRFPGEDEILKLREFIDKQNDREAAIADLVWASLVSEEFRFNH